MDLVVKHIRAFVVSEILIRIDKSSYFLYDVCILTI